MKEIDYSCEALAANPYNSGLSLVLIRWIIHERYFLEFQL